MFIKYEIMLGNLYLCLSKSVRPAECKLITCFESEDGCVKDMVFFVQKVSL